MMSRRIAAVSYLNTIPFLYGIEHAGIDLHASLLLSPPSGCAAALASHEADIGLIPIGAIPSIPGIQVVTPFCIGASAPVRTVVLVSNSPVEKIRKIYLDSHSLTSVRLGRILANEFWNITPLWEDLTDYTLLDYPEENTGYLLIGNKVFEQEGRFAYSYDLSVAWREMTGLPFVFAVWVAREEVLVGEITNLTRAFEFGTQHIREAIQCYGYEDVPYAYDYLTKNIDFIFDEQKIQAMEIFWEKGMKSVPAPNPG